MVSNISILAQSKGLPVAASWISMDSWKKYTSKHKAVLNSNPLRPIVQLK